MQGSAGTTEYGAPPVRRVQKQRGSKTPNTTRAGRVSRESGRPRNREIDEMYRSLIAAAAGGRAAARKRIISTGAKQVGKTKTSVSYVLPSRKMQQNKRSSGSLCSATARDPESVRAGMGPAEAGERDPRRKWARIEARGPQIECEQISV